MASKNEVAQLHPKLQVQDDEVAKAYQDIITILSALEAFYKKPEANNSLYELSDNPLFKNYILGNVEYKEYIQDALKKLNNAQNLNNQELSGIDKFISILDNESSVLYRKLRSTRE